MDDTPEAMAARFPALATLHERDFSCGSHLTLLSTRRYCRIYANNCDDDRNVFYDSCHGYLEFAGQIRPMVRRLNRVPQNACVADQTISSEGFALKRLQLFVESPNDAYSVKEIYPAYRTTIGRMLSTLYGKLRQSAVTLVRSVALNSYAIASTSSRLPVRSWCDGVSNQYAISDRLGARHACVKRS
jgi:hypothetical protein